MRTLKNTPLYISLRSSIFTFEGWARFRRLLYDQYFKEKKEGELSKILRKTPNEIRLEIAAIEGVVKKYRRAVTLASIPTRLAAVDECIQEHLINWGYLQTDMIMNLRQNWRVFQGKNHKSLHQGKILEVTRDLKRLWFLPGFELPFPLHPELRSAKYQLLLNEVKTPLKSRCQANVSVVIGPKSN